MFERCFILVYNKKHSETANLRRAYLEERETV